MYSEKGTVDSRATILARDIVLALESGQISAVFQQQIDLATEAVVGAEALCRWRHPTLGAITPDEFIPLAEQFGAIDDIGAYMLREASRLARTLAANGILIDMSVNVSPVQLSSDQACLLLLDQIDRLELVPQRLTLEVTESVEILDVAAVVACLERVRFRGIGVSIDDFGTGHASLEQLDRLPATEVKLDRSLVQSDEPTATAIISAVMRVAAERQLRVVAEGVETAHQQLRASAAGCHRAQGFLFGAPVSADAFEESLGAAKQSGS